MTPKEKAKELVGKMCLNDCTDENIDIAKQCALIAVDEIIQSHEDWSTEQDECLVYWQEVKQELERL